MSRASRAVVTVACFVAVAGAIAYFLRSQGDVGRHAFGPSSVGASEDDADEDRVLVRGTVLDAESGEPLAGATVTAPDGSTAVSDALGRFE
ncbi:MAG: hypothetical protein IT453_06320, partial [Planctomycetes bacterium]|nr:hypothetical protein [Planctomycetota bacterium]